MDFLQPASLAEALELRASYPAALAIQGGTDVMVELNFDKHRPPALLDLSFVDDFANVTPVVAPDAGTDRGRWLRIGAGVTWTTIIEQHASDLTGLAIAARTVGSPQIRNRATLAGSIASGSPAGDGLPMLVASGSRIEVESAARGQRLIDAADWLERPRKTAAEADELITAIHSPVTEPGAISQQFAKIGTRNAMVIAVASLGLHVDRQLETVGTGIGSAGPTVIAATAAEQYLELHLTESGQWEAPAALDAAVVARFGELVASAARPIDDVRGTAAYRTHAVGVMAR
ncbi:MAG: FAD binding domain-containing protein, partial [Thermoleophilia bacterium]|nr:FAD binding domain-containing protein [Thermoleophilia bacterium]